MDFDVECRKCGAEFTVNRNDGGHFPYFKWKKTKQNVYMTFLLKCPIWIWVLTGNHRMDKRTE